MSRLNIVQQRLQNQRLAAASFTTPAEAVAWFGAVQAQDYLQSLWAVGLRLPGATETTIEQAIAERSIVRSWPMRRTIHYMAAADVRWMMALLAPRAIPSITRQLHDLGIDEPTVARAADVVAETLADGQPRQRRQIYERMADAGIPTGDMRGLHVLGRLAHEGLICFGPRAGKQPTFVLLDAWVPPAPTLARDAALRELARRYFRSHGPATLKDFAWWSGLPQTDARIGLEQIEADLDHGDVDGQRYWYVGSDAAATEPPAQRAFLLPCFDEFFVAYRDRSAAAQQMPGTPAERNIAVLNPTIVLDGQVVGHWKRSIGKREVLIEPQIFRALTPAETAAYHAAAERYSQFIGLSLAPRNILSGPP